MKFTYLIALYLMPMYLIYGGKLLIIDFVPFASYTNLVNAIVKTLAAYHDITLLSIMDDTFHHPNVTFIKIKQPYLHIVSKKDIFLHLEDKIQFNLIRKTLLSITKEFVDGTFKENKIIEDIIANKSKYDLFFSFTHLSEHLLPLAHVVQAPLIQVKHLFLTFFYYSYYIHDVNKFARNHYPPGTPSIQEVLTNTSLLLINTVEVMGFSRPTESNTIEVGGLHCRPAQALPPELSDFIQKSGDIGFIYISFGTTISAEFPAKFTNALIKVLSKLPYQILWKFNKNIKTLPSNIMISKWFPQQDILGHNKIKLIITHGGMLSLQEAVYHGVPLLVIPITFDQPSNAFTVHKLGYGRYLSFTEMSEEVLDYELREVISNSSYKKKVKALSKLMRDQPLSPAERLIWWTNYLIRHNGFPIYRSNINKYSWKKVIEIDILLSFTVVLILFIYLIKFIVKNIIYYTTKNIKLKTI